MIAVGVDAGGTATVVAVERDGQPAGEAAGSAANAVTSGVAAAGDTIVATIRRALGGDEPASVHIGAAGAGRPEIAHGLQALVAQAFPGARVTVGHDAEIALRCAVDAGPGVVLVAGTGSVAYAQNGAVRALVGGHGHLIGDEGSAFALGLAAIRLYSRVLDGRAARDETSDLVARALQVSERDALHAVLYDRRPAPGTIAGLAPSIIAFAGKGNRASTKLVQEAARDLGDLLKAATRVAAFTDLTPPIVLAGGLLRENSLLTFLLETRISGDFVGSEIRRAGVEPVRGALRLAQAAATPA